MSQPAPILVYHLWPCAGWEVMHARLWGPLVESGLHEAASEIVVGLAPGAGRGIQARVDPTLKAQVIPLAHARTELPTIRLLWRMAKLRDPQTPMLYFHCRSAWRGPQDYGYQPSIDHNLMMTHFLIEKWREAVARLEEGFDVAACNIQYEPKHTLEGLHASGNFWWARAGALAKLECPDIDADRNEAEFWIGGLGRGRMFELHAGGKHAYEECNPRENYVCG